MTTAAPVSAPKAKTKDHRAAEGIPRVIIGIVIVRIVNRITWRHDVRI
jgi:hypothetical protein